MLGWIATALTASGLYLNGKKNIWCWLLWIVGDLLWIAHWGHLYATGGTFESSAIAFNVLFLFMNAKGWRDWRGDDRKVREAMQEIGALREQLKAMPPPRGASRAKPEAGVPYAYTTTTTAR